MPSISTLTFAVLILVSILIAGLIWAAGDILALFFIAMMLAYLFDPLATWLSCHVVARPWAALLITTALVVLLGGALALMGPIAYAEFSGLLRNLQEIFTGTLSRIRQGLSPYLPILRPLGLDGLVRAGSGGAAAPADISGPIATVVSGGIAFAGTMGLAMLTPVLTFYLLKDWPRMLLRVLKEIPITKRPVVRHLACEIDRVLSAFLHGQAWVCVCVGSIYTIGLLIT